VSCVQAIYLGSTNGIRINGRRVQSGRLKPGDELMIANFRYFVDIPATEAPLA
jgi:pSer/pThr/pTyr-binding forkhead associated (FHA) protein